jgi:catechol 2,3-dioxygenase-like lactoylglutathione lyase family enzyme
MNQPNLKLAVPFLLVTDMERSLDFYVNGLGFTLGNTWSPRALPRIPRS